ncbi:EamA family transporter [Carnobacterium divergens]|uniref:EamA family transporter n=1 Tax=Carnobacterium divergens TaxID=2748 RepID=A0AAW8RAN1_CARDV|nr:EamA family transporter [Carnobacterium divergens]MDT1957780.1 EamA family transporter [Carnobacterium divergens]MDT1973408.1 EamA family transporter [Carnobacterium divergens]MDT2011636.1 EamA family transporter [Carnobacterium divergens]
MDEKYNKKKLSLGILLIVIAAILSSLGQLAWKLGANGTGKYALFLYLIGFLAAGVGMFSMMIAFRYGDVSILQPMMSLGFGLSIVLGVLFLNETITWYKLLGTGLIIAGSVLLGIEGDEETV